MLEAIRKSSNSTFFKAFLSILALSFVAWGASDFFTGRNNATAMKVNGESISIYDVSEAFQARKSEMERQVGRTLDPQLSAALGLDRLVLENLITDAIILQEAEEKLGLRISNAHIKRSIVNSGAFNDETGAFSPTIYKNAIRAQGYTTESFETDMRKDLTKVLMRDAFLELPISEQSAAQAAKTALENIDLNVFYINRADINQVTVPSETEQRAYYERNTASFIEPEMRSADVISVTMQSLADKQTINSAQVEAYYTKHKLDFSTPETRVARHILVSDAETANTIKAELDGGADFAALAEKYSKDPLTKSKGGDLGAFERDDMVGAFSDAAFSLEVGNISDPVKTPFGYHIIEVTQINEPQAKPLNDVREEIETTLRTNMAADKYDALVAEMDDMILAGKTVAEIANETGLEMSTLENVQEADTRLNTDLKNVMFELNNGDVSDPIYTEEQVSVVHLTNVVPSRTKSFEESQVDIIQNLQEQARTEKLLQTTNEALAALKAGRSFTQVERELKLTKPLDTVKGITRNRTNAPAWLGGATLNKVFALDKNAFYATPMATPTGYAILKVAAKHSPNPTQAQVAAMQKQMTAGLRQDLEYQYIIKKRFEAELTFNDPLLRQVLGGNFTSAAMQ